MCVIVCKPKHSVLTQEDAKLMWESNPHGAGFCVWDEKSRTWKAWKGFMSFQELWRAIEPFTKVGTILVAHFRIVSRGTVCPEQTHPFEISLEEGTAYLFHNGTLSGELELSLGGSDTMELAHRLSQLRLRKEQLKLLFQEGGLLEPLIRGSRFALCLPGEETPLLVGDWEPESGLFVSNKAWKWRKTYTGLEWYRTGSLYRAGSPWRVESPTWEACTLPTYEEDPLLEDFDEDFFFVKVNKLTFKVSENDAHLVFDDEVEADFVGRLVPSNDMLLLQVEEIEFLVRGAQKPRWAITTSGAIYRLEKGRKARFFNLKTPLKLKEVSPAVRRKSQLLVATASGLIESYAIV